MTAENPATPNWAEEDLLELALSGPSGGVEEARPSLGEETLAEGAAAELGAMREDLARLRSALSDERILERSPDLRRRSEGLAQRVLERTTREDPSWRGDLILFSRFCRERMRSSMLLRLAAASLVIHLAAAPAVLAYLVLRKPVLEPGFRTGFEPRVESPYVEDPVEEPPVIRFLAPEEELPVPDLELLRQLDD